MQSTEIKLAEPQVASATTAPQVAAVGEEGFLPLFVKYLNGKEEGTHTTDVVPEASPAIPLLKVAGARGKTLEAYIAEHPAEAVAYQEEYNALWLGIAATAAITGTITLDNDKVLTVSKNQTKLLEIMLNKNEKDLKLVRQLASASAPTRAQGIINSMYHAAISNGSVPNQQYFVDRVTGRPAISIKAAMTYDNHLNLYLIMNMMFDKQQEVLESGIGTILICCTRRAGKTLLLCGILLMEALRTPGCTVIYVGETMELSEQLVDEKMQQFVRQLGLRNENGGPLDWRHLGNGSTILVRGLSNTKDPDQIRGKGAKVIVIDEFFHLRSELLGYLQREVLEPMQMDYADSYKFICAGTPPPVRGTYGEAAWNDWKCKKFSWTWRDNPHPVSVEAREEYIKRVLAEKGLTIDSPFARREYFGEWVYEDGLLLYPEFHTYQPQELPSLHWDRILIGLDYGVSDNDAIVALAWNDAEETGFVFYEEKFNRLSLKEREIEESQLSYLKRKVTEVWSRSIHMFPDMAPKEANKRIFWNADDSDQHVSDELRFDVTLPEDPSLGILIENAHKTDRTLMYDKIRDALRTGALLLPANGLCAKECEQTILLRGDKGEIYNEVDHRAFHPDALPALRYAACNVML